MQVIQMALTASAASVIEKHGGVPGRNNLLLDKLDADDYIQIMWAPSDEYLIKNSSSGL